TMRRARGTSPIIYDDSGSPACAEKYSLISTRAAAPDCQSSYSPRCVPIATKSTLPNTERVEGFGDRPETHRGGPFDKPASISVTDPKFRIFRLPERDFKKSMPLWTRWLLRAMRTGIIRFVVLNDVGLLSSCEITAREFRVCPQNL